TTPVGIHNAVGDGPMTPLRGIGRRQYHGTSRRAARRTVVIAALRPNVAGGLSAGRSAAAIRKAATLRPSRSRTHGAAHQSAASGQHVELISGRTGVRGSHIEAVGGKHGDADEESYHNRTHLASLRVDQTFCGRPF